MEMKELLSLSFLAIGLLPICAILAQEKKLPPDTPAGQDDELKVSPYTLPDPLVMSNGQRVADTSVWNMKRRPEILRMFEENVYGKAAVDRPEGMHWETTEDRNVLNGSAVEKKVMLYFSKENSWPTLE